MSETNYEVEVAKSFQIGENLRVVVTGDLCYVVGNGHALHVGFDDIEFIYEQMKELR
jgi:hypothetical protein